MKEILINKLQEYIRVNNPDIFFELEEDGKLSQYLSDKVSSVKIISSQLQSGQPAYITEDVCMDLLTQDLQPSRYNYICMILSEEFGEFYYQLQFSGTLQFEAINLVKYCEQVFKTVGFTKITEDSRLLRYAILGSVSKYVEDLTRE